MLALSPLSHFLWPIIIAALVAAVLGGVCGYFLRDHLRHSLGLDAQGTASKPRNGSAGTALPMTPAPAPMSLFKEDPHLGQLYNQRPGAEDIDDLTKAGIDPAAAKHLNEVGIWNFRQLASLTEAGKATLGTRFGIHVVNWSWIRARFKSLES